MGDDIGSGSVTDCHYFPTIDNILNSAELHHGKNQNKHNLNQCHHPLITQLMLDQHKYSCFETPNLLNC